MEPLAMWRLMVAAQESRVRLDDDELREHMPQIRSWEDIWTRLRGNWDGYIREYRVFLILLLLASVADAASTVHFMMQRGAGAELHPAVRSVSYLFGPVLGPILGKAVQVVVVVVLTVYFRRRAIFIFVPVILLYAWAAWYNVWEHRLYYPNLLWILDCLAV